MPRKSRPYGHGVMWTVAALAFLAILSACFFTHERKTHKMKETEESLDVSAMAMSMTTTPGAFIIFDALDYRNKPDLSSYGLLPIRVAYTAELWGRSVTNEPDEAAVKKVARSADPRVPLLLDVEHWDVQDDAVAEGNIDRLVRMVTWVREANPSVKVGFFGLAPIANGYLELNYARALNEPGFPQADAFRRAYTELQSDNERMARLAAVVDFVYPVAYTHMALGGGEAVYLRTWDTATQNAITEARKYSKPVYVFLWPQFYDVQAARGNQGPRSDHAFLPAQVWQHELAHVKALSADGVVIWGASKYRRAGWRDEDPWWAATQAFLE